LQDDSAITFGLRGGEQIEDELLRAAVAVQLQFGQAALVVEHQLGLELQALGELFTFQRLVDALAGIVIVVRDKGVGRADRNDQQRSTEKYR